MSIVVFTLTQNFTHRKPKPFSTFFFNGLHKYNAILLLAEFPKVLSLGLSLIFVIYVNDLGWDCPDVSKPKFADDFQLYKHIVYKLDHLVMCKAVTNIENWCKDWQLPISIGKCSIMHLGFRNLKYDYTVLDNKLNCLHSFKDLGVIVTDDLKSSLHCNTIVKTARARAAMIRRCFLSKDPLTLVWAFKVYVRPILEYASPVWSPYLIKDIELLESVQRRFTKLIPGMYNKSYEDRLTILKLVSLELRRLHIDLVFTFSLLKNHYDIDYSRFFTVRGSQKTRGHPLKLVVNMAKTNSRKYFFANRVVKVWNSLPSELVLVHSIAAFKRGLVNVDLSNFLSR